MNPKFGLAGTSALLIASFAAAQPAPEKPNTVSVDWNKIVIGVVLTQTISMFGNPVIEKAACSTRSIT